MFQGSGNHRVEQSGTGRYAGFLGAVAMLTALGFASTGAAQIFVDADAEGNNSGASWEDAFIELQSALTAAITGDEIWVACASYLPTERSDPAEPRSASFFVRSGVSVYGGFSGGEETLEQRQSDPLLNDCSLGDSSTLTEDFEGFFHLLTIDVVADPVVIDGFTIAGGRATGGTTQGAGARINNADVTFRNIRFDDVATVTNGPGFGGAVFAQNSALTLDSVHMNDCDSGRGGGVAAFGGSLTARHWTVTNCLGGFGGGPVLYMRNGASAEIADSHFENNRGNNEGGAILNDGSGSDLTIRRTVFFGNTVRRSGAIAHFGDNLILENSVLAGNVGRFAGGALRVGSSATASVTNSTIAFNENRSGVAIEATGSATVAINNSIVFGNFITSLGPGAPDVPQVGTTTETATLTASFSIIEGGFSGAGNLDIDPLFIQDADPGDGTWETDEDNNFGNLRLRTASPAIDAGDNMVLIDQTGTLPDTAADLPLDAGRRPRLEDIADVDDTGLGGAPVIDIGAFEFSALVFRDGFENQVCCL